MGGGSQPRKLEGDTAARPQWQNRFMPDVVVVGSGPNGLAAAVELARRGHSVRVIEGAATPGGGARTLELIEPGHWHDVCAAVHPLGAASPYLSRLPLREHGLTWLVPDVQLSHPLGGGRAVGLMLPLDETVRLLGRDGAAYRALVGPLLARIDQIIAGAMAPLQTAWRRPWTMARFGLKAIRSTSSLAARFDTDAGRALLAGLGAHSISSLNAATTGGVALVLAAAAHDVGWPIVAGGSQQIITALVGYLQALGGRVDTGIWVESLEQVEPAAAVFLDTSPAAAADIARHRLSHRMTRRLEHWRHGPGSHKVDWILSGPIPWADELSPRAATVHVGGTFEEIARSEQRAVAGEEPDRPFVLVAQPSLLDPRRAPPGRHIVWGYCHVPRGYTGDATGAIEAQIARFAPGFRDLIVARHVHRAVDLATYNPNYVGGDISGGELSLRQLLVRPQLAPNPYRIADRVYLCSASTPPGAGVHGMSGYHAVAYSGL